MKGLWDTIKWINIHITGAPEEEKERGKTLFNEVMTENLLNLEKGIQIQEAQKVPNKINPKTSTLRHSIVKLSTLKYKRES